MARKTVLTIAAIMLVVVVGAALAGCTTQTKTVVKEAELKVSKEIPIITDTKAKTVTIYAEVNGKYFSEPTRHGIVSTLGSNGGKSLLSSYVDPIVFNEALVKIGAKPGDNIKLDSPAGTIVEGTTLDVKVKSGSRTFNFADAVKAEPATQKFDVRFGGNRKNASELKTGCILCLDACAVGITSNAGWGWSSFKEGKVKFFGKEDVLPSDGSPVSVIFSIKK
ncbi:MAG: YdjY domain-containing protein [Actinomycetota bacterium]